MHLKIFKLFLLILLVGGTLNILPAKALDPTEATSEKYLIDHGHSPEVVRMINLQKERAEGKTTVTPPKPEGKIKKFIKNIWFEQDTTMPLTDFGYSNVKTVETDKSLIPATIQAIKSKLQNNSSTPNNTKGSRDPNEVNINDVKVRETN